MGCRTSVNLLLKVRISLPQKHSNTLLEWHMGCCISVNLPPENMDLPCTKKSNTIVEWPNRLAMLR